MSEWEEAVDDGLGGIGVKYFLIQLILKRCNFGDFTNSSNTGGHGHSIKGNSKIFDMVRD